MFNLPVRVKNRIFSSLELLQGPFRVYGTPRLQVLTQSARKGPSQKELQLPEMESGFRVENSDESPIQVRYCDDRLHLVIPPQSAVQRSSLFGWETIWNGFQANLVETRLSIPAYGRWRICSHSASTELFVRHPLENLDWNVSFLLKEFRNTFQAIFSRSTSGSVLAHGAIALL